MNFLKLLGAIFCSELGLFYLLFEASLPNCRKASFGMLHVEEKAVFNGEKGSETDPKWRSQKGGVRIDCRLMV